jgi:2-C-methyl-D-erythritol 2,4-cyclodiphosphate synthase
MTRCRIGYGYDSHRVDPARRLVLGGVEFPGEPGLAGHSDADVLLHAVIDALLGAAALGDIGMLFPDGDEAWRGADSAGLLAIAFRRVAESGYALVNIDATVVCERPKIAPFADAIRERIATVLGAEKGAISVKGKTNEKMDDVGKGIGIEAYAVCLLEKIS